MKGRFFQMKYKALFMPIDIGCVTVKNRVAMAPINNSNQIDRTTAMINQRVVDFYVDRARGGAGLIVTGVFKVENNVEKCINIKEGLYKWAVFSRKSLPYFTEIANQIHSFGGKLFIQLSAGPGRVTPPDVVTSGVTPVSASDNSCFYVPGVKCRALETDEVAKIVAAFGEMAKLIRMVGIDGIEVHGHEGYLIDQFTTEIWNRRTDKYGGDLRGRLTFPIEILEAIKTNAGKDFPVTYRMGARHFISNSETKTTLIKEDVELGRGLEESIEMAKILTEKGYDALSIDTGCYESLQWAHPPGYFPHGFSLEFASKIKENVGKPVMLAGRMGNPDIAEEAVTKGKVDIIALGRDLMADSDWTNKVSKNDTAQIRPCIGCHEGCINRPGLSGAMLSCSVNPGCGRETEHPILPTSARKTILVAGGGVAGMECARIATARGHKVILFEKSDRLGGHLIEAAVPDFKKDIWWLLQWYIKQLKDNKVQVELSTEVDLGLINNLMPDAVIVATGSIPCIPPIKGLIGSKAVNCCELLRGKKKAKGRIVVIGGGLEGCETALWLAMKGKNVTVVEMLQDVCLGTYRANRIMLRELMQRWGIKVCLGVKAEEVTDSRILLSGDKEERSFIEYDTLILATGMKSDNRLQRTTAGVCGEIYSIGDCNAPRKIHDAIWEGWNLGRLI